MNSKNNLELQTLPKPPNKTQNLTLFTRTEPTTFKGLHRTSFNLHPKAPKLNPEAHNENPAKKQSADPKPETFACLDQLLLSMSKAASAAQFTLAFVGGGGGGVKSVWGSEGLLRVLEGLMGKYCLCWSTC